MKVIYYSKQGAICTKRVGYKLYKDSGRTYLRLDNVSLTLNKGERITHIGLIRKMFRLNECIIDYTIKDVYNNLKRDISITLYEQMILLREDDLIERY